MRPRKKKEGSTSPCSIGLSPHEIWLRERLENSNFILVKVPFEMHLPRHGTQAMNMDPDQLPQVLAVTGQDIERLRQAELQQTYARMLGDGLFSSQAELAHHLGVSRVWVSRVLYGVKRNAG